MYDWRKMTELEREQALSQRQTRNLPWHSPPHFDFEGINSYPISATCYEHSDIIGKAPERLTECENETLRVYRDFCLSLHAWCILPNHYHGLVTTDRVRSLRRALGEFHGRSSCRWNGEDNCRGRKVWCNCFERRIKSERHFWATLNYVHHNPVHHGYVNRWQDWPWSSARAFLEQVGRERAVDLWASYPILDYGKKWDL